MEAPPYDRSRAIALAGLDYAHFLPKSSDAARFLILFYSLVGYVYLIARQAVNRLYQPGRKERF